jgi:glycerol-3-phosphate acyltransferase PlsX
VAVDLVTSGEAAAVFSAGHSGATVLLAHSAFGSLPGVDRPALAVTVPTLSGAAVLLDVGANLQCRPEHLVQFASMGAAFASALLATERPRVGLLSIGEEAEKGNELIREAHARLKEGRLNFIGNVEARELFSGRADVVVCDGFTGNVALKVGEGLVEALEQMLREELSESVVSEIGALFGRRAFERFRRRVDYAEHGAAVLLGVSRLALIGHGRSSARAVENGIAMAARLVEGRVMDGVVAALGVPPSDGGLRAKDRG